MTLNELAINARKAYCIKLHKAISQMTDINQNDFRIVKNCLEYMSLNLQYFLISQNISIDLKVGERASDGI